MVERARRWLLGALGVTAGAALAGAYPRALHSPGGDALPVRILPIGDSLTRGAVGPYGPSPLDGGYRTRLWRRLREAGFEVEFVGSQRSGPPDIGREHEGHNGWTIADTRRVFRSEWSSWEADFSLLMIGTNDVWWGPNPDGAHAALRDQLADSGPRLRHRFLLASIPPFADPQLNARAARYNEAIRARSEKSAWGPVVTFVDANAALDPARHLAPDGVHLNPAGYAALADVWYEALVPLLQARRGASSVGMGAGGASHAPTSREAQSSTHVAPRAGTDRATR